LKASKGKSLAQTIAIWGEESQNLLIKPSFFRINKQSNNMNKT